MRIIILLVLLALTPSVFAGVVSCRWDDRSSWIYYPVWYSDTRILYDVYCPRYDPLGLVPRSWAWWYTDYRLIVQYSLQQWLMLYKITAFKYWF